MFKYQQFTSKKKKRMKDYGRLYFDVDMKIYTIHLYKKL